MITTEKPPCSLPCSKLAQIKLAVARPAWLVLCSPWLAPVYEDAFAMAGNSRNEAHMGPFPLGKDGGTLTASDRSEIYRKTGCSAAVRFRQQWGERCLSISGPASWLSEAKRLAEECIANNGTEYGRAEPATSSSSAGQLEELRTRVDWLNGQQSYYNNQVWALRGEMQQMAHKMQELQQLAASAVQANAGLAKQIEEELNAQKNKKRKKKEAKEKDNKKKDDEDGQKTDNKKAKDEAEKNKANAANDETQKNSEKDAETTTTRDEEQEAKGNTAEKKRSIASPSSPSPTSPAAFEGKEVKKEQSQTEVKLEVKKEKEDSSGDESNRTKQSDITVSSPSSGAPTVIVGDGEGVAPQCDVKEEEVQVDKLPLTSVAKASEQEALG